MWRKLACREWDRPAVNAAVRNSRVQGFSKLDYFGKRATGNRSFRSRVLPSHNPVGDFFGRAPRRWSTPGSAAKRMVAPGTSTYETRAKIREALSKYADRWVVLETISGEIWSHNVRRAAICAGTAANLCWARKGQNPAAVFLDQGLRICRTRNPDKREGVRSHL